MGEVVLVRKGYTQMNNINLLGNLTKDPDVRYTKTGRVVATFTLACTNTYIDSATNETKEQTAFINCVAWGKLGETLNTKDHSF